MKENFWKQSMEIMQKHGYTIRDFNACHFYFLYSGSQQDIIVKTDMKIYDMKTSYEIPMYETFRPWLISSKFEYDINFYDVVGRNLEYFFFVNHSHIFIIENVEEKIESLRRYVEMMKELKEFWKNVKLEDVPEYH